MTLDPGPGHDRWGDSAAAFLLGALPEDERDGFEAHLAGCPACREEVDDLAVAADALPAAALPLVPPPELKGRIMSVVEREAALLAAAGPQADRPAAPATPRRRRLPSLSLRRLAAVAAALAVGVVAGVAGERLLAGDERTIAAQVDSRAAPGARVRLEIDDGRATLVARGLPAPPPGRVYQVWLKRPGRAPEPTTALFEPSRDGAAAASVPGELDGVDQVLVTHEPRGGSRAPTRDPLIVASTS